LTVTQYNAGLLELFDYSIIIMIESVVSTWIQGQMPDGRVNLRNQSQAAPLREKITMWFVEVFTMIAETKPLKVGSFTLTLTKVVRMEEDRQSRERTIVNMFDTSNTFISVEPSLNGY
jgi:hypothetical protein